MALVIFLCGANDGETQEDKPAMRPPQIARLDVRDVVFQQYLDDVAAGRQAVFSRHPVKTLEELASGLVVYTYTPNADDDIFVITARCNIPYDAFVTLNRWQSRPLLSGTEPILMPSMPGLFIPDEPGNDLERLVMSGRLDAASVPLVIRLPSGEKTRFRFIPGDSFTPNERFFFLHPGYFIFPLRKYRLTSPFGMRLSPISGNARMHGGLDLAAPLGTPVFASRNGTVTETGNNATYGKYIIITHTSGWTSLYGHLSKIDVVKNQNVKAGAVIGTVGNTGMSTGPHLHFELRENGRPQDPRRVIISRPLQ
ncbi:MAG: M23 family metallopeptidase [Spirochaetaceae bacterium]|nr:M23 family metallopeptidase [Spirochaetaceae bacterium]